MRGHAERLWPPLWPLFLVAQPGVVTFIAQTSAHLCGPRLGLASADLSRWARRCAGATRGHRHRLR